jgi:serine/threonine-protein kinase
MSVPPRSFRLETLPGKTLHGAYEVEELIGMGAMGAVYRGRQIRLRRTVAIKVPKPDLAANPDYIQRFEREALTMAKLVHENVVQIFDVFVSPNPAEPSFIVMEFVEGCELETFLHTQERSLTVAAVCELFTQVARGIDSANSRGVVHRDIKPSNIVVTLPSRVAKIMDFGIARVEMENVFATQDTKTMGTPAYMAPEQVTAKPLGPACDIYAFAMMIFRLLARRLPFDCSTSSALLFAQVHTPPIPLDICNPRIPRAAALAVAEGLAKKPLDRPATATQLAAKLTAGLEPLAQRPFGELFLPTHVSASLAGGSHTATSLTTEADVHEETSSYPAAAPGKAEPTTVVDTQLFVNTKLPASMRRPVMLSLIAGGGCLLLLLGWMLIPGDPVPAKADDPPAVQPTPIVTPLVVASVATPVPPTPSPEPRPTPLPSPTPRPTPSPTPAPEPTPSPAPTPSQAPSPAATPDSAATQAAVATSISPRYEQAPYSAEFDPAVTPHLTGGWKLDRVREEITEFVAQRIERAIYRDWWSTENNALMELGGPFAEQIEAIVKKHSKTHSDISVKFQILSSSAYWEDHALLQFELSGSGHPRKVADPNFREPLFKLDDQLVARARRVENRWRLESLWGNYAQLEQLSQE